MLCARWGQVYMYTGLSIEGKGYFGCVSQRQRSECCHSVCIAFFIPVFPVTRALRVRLTVFVVPVRSSWRPESSMFPLLDNKTPSSSALVVMNMSSLDTGGGIGRRVGWKNRPGLFDDDGDTFTDTGLT